MILICLALASLLTPALAAQSAVRPNAQALDAANKTTIAVQAAQASYDGDCRNVLLKVLIHELYRNALDCVEGAKIIIGKSLDELKASKLANGELKSKILEFSDFMNNAEKLTTSNMVDYCVRLNITKSKEEIELLRATLLDFTDAVAQVERLEPHLAKVPKVTTIMACTKASIMMENSLFSNTTKSENILVKTLEKHGVQAFLHLLSIIRVSCHKNIIDKMQTCIGNMSSEQRKEQAKLLTLFDKYRNENTTDNIQAILHYYSRAEERAPNN